MIQPLNIIEKQISLVTHFIKDLKNNQTIKNQQMLS